MFSPAIVKMSGDQWGIFNEISKNNINKDSLNVVKFDLNESGCIPKMNVPQMLPQPSGVPWSINGMSWGSSNNQNVPVEFNAAPLYKNNIFSNLHTKRKSETESLVPRKQHITEEKMAASFDGMHISCSYTTHNISNDGNTSDGDVDISTQGPRIVLSPELIKVKPEPILPPSLVERLQRPCTSLVLWRPPKRIVHDEDGVKDPNNNPEDENESPRRRGVLETVVDEMSKPNFTNNIDGDMDVEL